MVAIRKEKGIKQKEFLAKLQTLGLDISPTSLSRLEGQYRLVQDYEVVAIAKALETAGFDLADIVRVHYYVTDPAFVDVVFPILGGYFGDIRPAATMIVCGLAKPEMKIEIEATALRRTAP